MRRWLICTQVCSFVLSFDVHVLASLFSLRSCILYFHSAMCRQSGPDDEDLQWHWCCHTPVGGGEEVYFCLLYQCNSKLHKDGVLISLNHKMGLQQRGCFTWDSLCLLKSNMAGVWVQSSFKRKGVNKQKNTNSGDWILPLNLPTVAEPPSPQDTNKNKMCI